MIFLVDLPHPFFQQFTIEATLLLGARPHKEYLELFSKNLFSSITEKYKEELRKAEGGTNPLDAQFDRMMSLDPMGPGGFGAEN